MKAAITGPKALPLNPSAPLAPNDGLSQRPLGNAKLSGIGFSRGVLTPLGPDAPGTEPSGGGTFPGPVLLQLYCATPGASLAYRPGDRWEIYREPLRLPAGTTTVLVRAGRIGYRDSEERRASFTAGAG